LTRCEVNTIVKLVGQELQLTNVHKILVVIEPLLIDEDYYARVEGREIISNLSKAEKARAVVLRTYSSA
jgi:hypothetical protein